MRLQPDHETAPGTEGPSPGSRGFTMFELIVVIAIIAVLASIVVPLAGVFDDRAREDATEKEMKGIEQALVAWYEDHGSFPADLDSLESGGYLADGFEPGGHDTDAWNNAYVYTVAGMTAGLVSPGIDRVGATGDDLTLTVRASMHAREETRDEIGTIHVALRNYESRRITDGLPNLPNHWPDQGGTDGAFQELVDEGLLPDEVRFLTDSWGSSYAYGGTPSDYVSSPNLGGGP